MLMRIGSGFKEGEIFNKYLFNRFKSNQNILCCITGGTGSSKSYQDLRRAELWYDFYFKKEFPEENICFSLGEVMRRLTSGKLKKGEILVMEEAGVNLGSLDFQQRVVKLFNYVLQSFRSMNVGIFFNLPYLGMLSKQARLLIHTHFVTCGIDREKKVSKSKCYFRQVNQQTGKVYPKYLRLRVDGKVRTIKKFTYKLPTPRLRVIYEAKKLKFVSGLTEEFTEYLNQLDKENMAKERKPTLTERQEQVYNLACKGHNQIQIGEKLGLSQQRVSQLYESLKKRGYKIEITQNSLGKQELQVVTPIPAPL